MSRLLDTLYVILLVVGSPWLLYRAIFRKRNRRGWLQKLFGIVPVRQSNRPCVWMHAVSVGEVNLLATVIKRLQSARPELEIVISTTTETGFDLASSKYANHPVFFCPLDFSWAIRRTLDRLKPEMIVLAELEVWPNLVSIADQQNIPLAIVNGRLSRSSFEGYRKFDWLLRSTFEKLTFVAAANETYAQRFRALGVPTDRVAVTGNIKFDGVATDRDDPAFERITNVAGFGPGDFVVVAGSTQPEEDLLLAEVYRRLAAEHSELRLVLVPRHPETADATVAAIGKLGIEVRRRSLRSGEAEAAAESQLQHRAVPKSNFVARRTKALTPALCQRERETGVRGIESGCVPPIFMVDMIGELGAWWSRADAAYVGGSMGKRGGQNMIEPAAFGIPVSFGPNTRNFRAIVQMLLENDAATVVRDHDGLTRFITRVMDDPDWANAIGQRARDLVLKNAGAADQTVRSLLAMLPAEQGQRDAA